MSAKDLAIYGFGGFGRELATIIHQINQHEKKWNLIGFIDDAVEKGITNHYGKVLGGIDFLINYNQPLAVAIAIGSPEILKKITENLNNPNISFPNIIASNVYFFDSESVKLGFGNIITNFCKISCGVNIGNFNVLNGAVSLGHDVSVGNYNVMFPETRVSGMVNIGDNNFFGARSFLIQNITVGNNVRVSAGSFVMRSTIDNYLYSGNPARAFEN